MVKPHRLSCINKGGQLLISILFLPNLDQIQSSMKQRHCVYMNAILIWNHQCISHISVVQVELLLQWFQNLVTVCSVPALTVLTTAHNTTGITQNKWPIHTHKLSEHGEYITVDEEGQYICRKDCGKGFSRFQRRLQLRRCSYSHKHAF